MVIVGVFPFQGKTHMVESGIEPGTSWLVVRSSDHQATRLFTILRTRLTMGYPTLKEKGNYSYKLHLSTGFRNGSGDVLCEEETEFLNMIQTNFMVTPCINNIQHFNFQLMHTT